MVESRRRNYGPVTCQRVAVGSRDGARPGVAARTPPAWPTWWRAAAWSTSSGSRPRPARYGELARPLPDPVWAALGVDRLWAHQAAAIDEVRAGRSVVLATGTASGKSLCYQAPIAEAALAPLRPSTALCIFPTKALAQDQARALFELDLPGLVPATYDGDCSPEERTWARGNATVLLTNPEMLHSALLPHHAKWSTYLARLEHVVVDELHVLRGIFGTHVSHLLRRLRRVCNLYGSDPTFVFCSATIGRPGRLATELCGLPVTEITDDASPKGRAPRRALEPRGRGDGRHRPHATTTTRRREGRAQALDQQGDRRHRRPPGPGGAPHHRLLPQPPGRRGRRRRDPAPPPRELRDSVRAYRGGYLAAERREIEAELFSGRLRAVVATSALELGHRRGRPRRLRAQRLPRHHRLALAAGRAGRARGPGVASPCSWPATTSSTSGSWPTPHEVFTRPPEPAVINPANPYVLLPHLACAAYEHPLTPADERWWGDLLDDGVRRLVLDDQLRLRPPPGPRRRRLVRLAAGPPTASACAAASPSEVRIVAPTADGDELIGTVDLGRAPSQVHPGAVYLHQGAHWKVAELDLDARAGRGRARRRRRVDPAPDRDRDPHRRGRTASARSAAPASASAPSRSAARSPATAAGTRSPARPWATRSSTCPPST